MLSYNKWKIKIYRNDEDGAVIIKNDGYETEIFKTIRNINQEEVMSYKKILKDAKKKDCPYCGAQQSKIEFAKPTTFYEVLEEGVQRLTQSMVRERLKRITDEELEQIGFTLETTRSEWMDLQFLHVHQVYVRPSYT